MMRRAICRGASGSGLGVTISTNSSPPRRATVSMSRTTLLSRCATTLSSSSPARCPSESFTSLKRSRSSKMTANVWPCRSASTMDWLMRSSIKTRFGSPVRASWVAKCRNCLLAVSRPCVRALTTCSSVSTSRRTMRSFCHLRVSAFAHCRTSMASNGFLTTNSLSELFRRATTSVQS